MANFHGFQRLEANFTPTPNQFFDEIIRGDYPKCVIVIVAVLIRETLGWQDNVTGERRIEAELALSQITEKSALSINSARQGIREAIAAGFVIETASHDNRHGARYALRWADTERQKEAITRTRLATRDRLAEVEPALQTDLNPDAAMPDSGGANFGAPNFGGAKFAPTKRKRSPEKKDTNVSIKETLNVSESEKQAPIPPQRPMPNAQGKGIYAIAEKEVAEVVALTGDSESLRRFQQLWEIAERNECLEAWKAALRAVQRRLRASGQGTLERPGAYFCKVCVEELEKREVFVPTNAQKQADAGVAALIRQEILRDFPPQPVELLADEVGLPLQQVPLANPLTPELLSAELGELERQGGKDSQDFLGYVEGERKRYKGELTGMRESAQQRLLDVFDRPDRRRELYR
ncbi:hypothetical protein, partial [Armatimonas sp.]|uniref:hypothetical protein n=1 Tax=Armatimonas sp. TaxID=1872638 RepID=UPI003752AE0D